jgi:uncharacterized protein (TIGR04255 family)
MCGMSVDLSQWPRVIFNKNPLKVVVLQVRFSPILALAQPAGVAPFQEAIRERYPRAEAPAQQVMLAFGPNGPLPPTAQQGPWRFLDDEGWIVGLATDYVSLEATSYERYEEFEPRVTHVLEAARDVLGLRERGRLGLRYVNEIHHPDARTIADWRNLLNPELLGVSGGKLLGPRVTQTIQQIDVRLDDGVLTVRHGCTTSPDGPAPYAIDLDAHDDDTRPFAVDEILGRSASFRAWIGGFFRNSLGKDLYEFLEPRESEG